MSVVYPPIDERSRGGDGSIFRTQLGIDNLPVVLAVGNVARGRGQDQLVRAVSHVQPRLGPMTLVVVGSRLDRPKDRAFEAELRELAPELGVELVLAGERDSLADAYAAASVVVNPAVLPESFGRVVCEALVAGTPAISTRVGAVPEALSEVDGVTLVDPGSPRALGAALMAVMEDPGRPLWPPAEAGDPRPLPARREPRLLQARRRAQSSRATQRDGDALRPAVAASAWRSRVESAPTTRLPMQRSARLRRRAARQAPPGAARRLAGARSAGCARRAAPSPRRRMPARRGPADVDHPAQVGPKDRRCAPTCPRAGRGPCPRRRARSPGRTGPARPAGLVGRPRRPRPASRPPPRSPAATAPCGLIQPGWRRPGNQRPDPRPDSPRGSAGGRLDRAVEVQQPRPGKRSALGGHRRQGGQPAVRELAVGVDEGDVRPARRRDPRVVGGPVPAEPSGSTLRSSPAYEPGEPSPRPGRSRRPRARGRLRDAARWTRSRAGRVAAERQLTTTIDSRDASVTVSERLDRGTRDRLDRLLLRRAQVLAPQARLSRFGAACRGRGPPPESTRTRSP